MLRNVALVLAALAACASPALAQFERCHTNIMTPHHFLDMNKFTGVWYPLSIHYSRTDQARVPDFVCMDANISATAQAENFTIDETYLQLVGGEVGGPVKVSYTFLNGNSTGYTPAPLPSKWLVFQDGSVIGQSTIVASDEGSWALQYLCTLENGVMREVMTLLGRNRFLDPTVKGVLNDIIYSIGFRTENGYQIIQSGCSTAQ